MTLRGTCRCVGSFCRCNGTEILKDGASTRIPVMMRDSAGPEPLRAVVEARMTDSDRAYAEMKARDAVAWLGRDASTRLTSSALADKSPEYQQGIADGAYEAMCERDRNAWRR